MRSPLVNFCRLANYGSQSILLRVGYRTCDRIYYKSSEKTASARYYRQLTIQNAFTFIFAELNGKAETLFIEAELRSFLIKSSSE